MQIGSRSGKGFRNIIFTFIASICSLFLSFVSRGFFIKLLGNEYLGLNGLFSNVLSFLSLAEMGVGVAINFALYQPVQEQNTERIKSLMKLYQKFYISIGIFIFSTGLILTPFLPFLIKDIPNIPHIYTYFILYVANSALSYFFTYKRSLIICDQKEYISIISTFISKVFVTIFQIIVLYKYHSYLLYLTVNILCTVSENIAISIVADNIYPFLRDKNVKPLEQKEKKRILDNVYSLIFHKVGTVIVFSSDNLIISKTIGLVSVGLYSNYTLLIQSINTIVKKLFDTLTASVGNLIVSSSDSHSEEVFYRMLFANMILYSLSSILLLNLIEPFIRIWIGEKYLLSRQILILAIISFFLSGMRKSILIFKDAAGVFKEDRLKPLVEGLANIIYSVPLALKFGISGVILGTILSTLTVSFWYEAFVFFKVVFHKPMTSYLVKQFKYFLFAGLTGMLTLACCDRLPYFGFFSLMINALVCFVIYMLSVVFFYRNTDEFCFFVSFAKRLLIKAG